MKTLLSFVSDHFERYSMFKELAPLQKEFREAAEQLLQTPGIRYFRDDSGLGKK